MKYLNNFLKEIIIIFDQAIHQEQKLMSVLKTCSYWSKNDYPTDSRIGDE